MVRAKEAERDAEVAAEADAKPWQRQVPSLVIAIMRPRRLATNFATMNWRRLGWTRMNGSEWRNR